MCTLIDLFNTKMESAWDARWNIVFEEEKRKSHDIESNVARNHQKLLDLQAPLDLFPRLKNRLGVGRAARRLRISETVVLSWLFTMEETRGIVEWHNGVRTDGTVRVYFVLRWDRYMPKKMPNLTDKGQNAWKRLGFESPCNWIVRWWHPLEVHSTAETDSPAKTDIAGQQSEILAR